MKKPGMVTGTFTFIHSFLISLALPFTGKLQAYKLAFA
jgi:hypothetical protein